MRLSLVGIGKAGRPAKIEPEPQARLVWSGLVWRSRMLWHPIRYQIVKVRAPSWIQHLPIDRNMYRHRVIWCRDVGVKSGVHFAED